MPNTSVRAAAEGMPTVNRRRAMLGAGATMAALAATTLSAEPASSDAELIRLGSEFDRLRAEYAPLKEEQSRLLQLWLSECGRRNVSLDADRAEELAIAEGLGLVAAERAAGPVEDALALTTETILATPATTLAGLAVKAKAIRQEALPYRPDVEPTVAEYQEMDWDDEVVLRFVFEIERMAGGVS